MRILLHCNGGGSLGVGHVMRSLALAEAAVTAGHEVVVAGRFEGTFLQGQLAAARVEVIPMTAEAENDPDDLVELVRRLRPDVLHVDSYLASARLRDRAASAGVEARVPATVLGNIVFSNMEDGTFGRRSADVVVDPTLGAELSQRPDDGSTRLLLGSRFSPLRGRVIEALRDTKDTDQKDTKDTKDTKNTEGPAVKDAEVESTRQARSVLVVMGGTDPSGMAPVAVELLAKTGLALDVTVVTVGQNVQRARDAAQGSALSLDVVAPVDDLPSLMSRQDLVISAAGTSVWELLCLGVPTVVAWTVDNQRDGYERVVAAGAVVGLGGPGLGGPGLGGHGHAVDVLRDVLTDGKARADLVMAGHHIVDGLGSWRVVRAWEMAVRADVTLPRETSAGSVAVATALVARPATLNDSRLLWLWRNDPVTRAGSRSAAEVPWDAHLRWLAASLAERDRRLFLVSDTVGPVGTVRWDLVGTPGHPLASGGREDHEWEVSVTVAPQRRGQSLARLLLRAGEGALSEETSAPTSGATSGVASESTRAGGTDVTAYLAVVHVDNLASIRLFETSGYLPDLPPDPRGFMRYRKIARVP